MESRYEIVEGRLEVRGWKECFTPEALAELRAADASSTDNESDTK